MSKITKQILSKIKFGFKTLITSFRGPVVLVLESSSSCQADCVQCTREKLQHKKENMTYEVFCKAVNEAKKLKIKIFQLSFYGEPLLDPDLSRKLRYLRTLLPESVIVMNTNGNLLNEELIRNFIENKLSELRISIEGNDVTEYEAIRKNLKYSDLLKNIELLNSLRKECSSNISVVIWSRSLNDYPLDPFKFRAFWSKYVDKVFISHENKYLLSAKEPLLQKMLPCIWAFGFLVIYADGRVTMCDGDWYGKYIVGDIKTSTIKKIWFSPKLIFNRILNLAGMKKLISICSECPYRVFYSYIQNKEFMNYQY
jgi:radical SAM protein with 4Fe4S-binding SPASM domain